MDLTWKDLIATLFAGGAAGIYYSYLQNINLPVVSNYRLASLVLLIAGIFICAFSSTANAWPINKDQPVLIVSAVLGFAALGLSIAGMITGNRTVVTALIFDLMILWLITTLRHAFAK